MILDSEESVYREVSIMMPKFCFKNWALIEEPIFRSGKVKFDKNDFVHYINSWKLYISIKNVKLIVSVLGIIYIKLSKIVAVKIITVINTLISHYKWILFYNNALAIFYFLIILVQFAFYHYIVWLKVN